MDYIYIYIYIYIYVCVCARARVRARALFIGVVGSLLNITKNFSFVVEVLGFGAVCICRSMPTFRRNMLSPSSGAEVTGRCVVLPPSRGSIEDFYTIIIVVRTSNIIKFSFRDVLKYLHFEKMSSDLFLTALRNAHAFAQRRSP
jgi:hypothetical protein